MTHTVAHHRLVRPATRLAACALVLSACVVALRAEQKESLPDADKRALLLEEAASLTNIWSPHGTPFHLRANVSSFNGGHERKGKFEIWWQSPSRFHDEITWGDQTTTHIANGDSLSTVGDDLHRRDTYRILRLLGFQSRMVSGDGKSLRAHRTKIDGQLALCINITKPLPLPDVGSSTLIPSSLVVGGVGVYTAVGEACLDPSTNLPIELNDGVYRFELREYAALGSAFFPRSLRQFAGTDEIVRIEAEVIEKLDPGYQGFSPRDGAMSEAWCGNEKPPVLTSKVVAGSVVAPLQNGMVVSGPVHEAMLVFRVAADGSISGLRAFDAKGETTITPKERAKLLQATFAPATCNDSAIAAEYIFYGFPLAH
jgi:hypothetical protein